jgi:hypothetical protein
LTPTSSNSSTMLMTGFMKSSSMFRKTLADWAAQRERERSSSLESSRTRGTFQPKHPWLWHLKVTSFSIWQRLTDRYITDRGPKMARWKGSVHSTYGHSLGNLWWQKMSSVMNWNPEKSKIHGNKEAEAQETLFSWSTPGINCALCQMLVFLLCWAIPRPHSKFQIRRLS